MLTVDLSVEVLGLTVVAREPLGAVGDVNATINCALHGSENPGASGCARQTNIEVGAERTRSIIDILNIENSTGDLGTALVDSVQLEFFQQLDRSSRLVI